MERAVNHRAGVLEERSGSGVPGGTLVYELAVQNTRNEGAQGVIASRVVPTYTSFAAGASSPGWSCAPAGGGAGALCTLPTGLLLAGVTARVVFAVTVERPAGLVVATPLDPDLTLDVGSVTTSAGTVIAGNAASDAIPTCGCRVPSSARRGSTPAPGGPRPCTVAPASAPQSRGARRRASRVDYLLSRAQARTGDTPPAGRLLLPAIARNGSGRTGSSCHSFTSQPDTGARSRSW